MFELLPTQTATARMTRKTQYSKDCRYARTYGIVHTGFTHLMLYIFRRRSTSPRSKTRTLCHSFGADLGIRKGICANQVAHH